MKRKAKRAIIYRKTQRKFWEGVRLQSETDKPGAWYRPQRDMRPMM